MCSSSIRFGINAMKLPRWLVICLLGSSVLAVLAAAGWWWVTWPERTAREFADRFGAGRIGEAEQMLTQAEAVVLLIPPLGHWSEQWKEPLIDVGPRSGTDRL